jgi:hypothetical protein
MNPLSPWCRRVAPLAGEPGLPSANAGKIVLDLRLRVRQHAARGTRTWQNLERSP